MRITSILIAYLTRLIDVGIIYLSGFLALQIRFWGDRIPNESYQIFMLGSCVIYLIASSGSFNQQHLPRLTTLVGKVTKLWSLTCVTILLVIIFTQSGNLLSRIWLALWIPLVWLNLILTNLLLENTVWKWLILRPTNTNVAIIGKGFIANKLVEKINSQHCHEYHLVSIIHDIDDQSEIQRLSNALLDEIWIALPIRETGKLPRIIEQLGLSSASIKYAPDLFTLRLINHGSTEVLGVNMLNLNASPFTNEALLIKNIEDFVISLFILICFSPLLLILAVAVKITSPGPILYRQERVGLNGRPFMMLKFRSMPADIEKNGVRWGNSETKTVHPFSSWMRRMNLDELPQFINVIRGQMSIVGPRPERVEFIEAFSKEIPNYAKKHLVKAGITGWAQIHGLRGDTDLNKRIEYDLFYIENWSLLLDLKIMLLTAIEPFLTKNHSTR